MQVKELIEKLKKFNEKDEVIIRFAVDNEDDIGYVLEPIIVDKYFENDVAIYANYTATKEDCDFIGQVDLKEAYKRLKQE